MIEGARWRRWVFFHIPLLLFIIFLLFPFYCSIGTVIFITYLVPQTLLFIPLADIIRNFHLVDTPCALILTYPTFLIPSCSRLLMRYFKTSPKELEDSAWIDWAPRWKA